MEATYAKPVNESMLKPAAQWTGHLDETVKFLFQLDHHEQVEYFQRLRMLILEERDKRTSCIRSEIEAGQRRIDEILKGQEIIARIS